METTTLYNLDDYFYTFTATDELGLWVIYNILTSAVGNKIIYEIMNPISGATATIEESHIQTKIAEKIIVKDIDDVRIILTEKMELLLSNVEAERAKYVKSRLKRVLSGKQRKIDKNSEDDIRKKTSSPDNTLDATLDIEDELAGINRKIKWMKGGVSSNINPYGHEELFYK